MTQVTYRSEVVGSLLRPPYLLEARRQWEAGQLGAPDFKAIEDRAVNEAIALQEATGVDVITDGEMRRFNFFGHFVDAFEGFAKDAMTIASFRDEKGEEIPVITIRKD